MISICSVVFNRHDCLLDEFTESLLSKLKYVDEVFVAVVDEDVHEFETECKKGGVKFTMFSCPVKSVTHNGHGVGLHRCLERTKNDLILFSDPDIFFYSAVDETYLRLMEKYDLNIVGVSHPAAINRCYTFFPCVINCLVKKSTLPGPDWLNGWIRDRPTISKADLERYKDDKAHKLLPGMWLSVGAIPGLAERFPNKSPDCIFDTGSNLWLWNEERKGKWLAFQTPDCHNYTTALCRGNVKIEKLPKEKLLYHAVGGCLKDRWDTREEFRKTYHDFTMHSAT